jgi:very-short-patch-repair endonuclease
MKSHRRAPLQRERAKTLRDNMPEAERKLWQRLQASRLGGYKFSRQIAIGPYFADFCCRTEMLVIELDGSQHGEQRNYDAARDAFLRSRRYRVLRFWNHDVMSDVNRICDLISAVLDGDLVDIPERFE